MKNLENKVIIITGAAMGLGLAAAKELASQGASLTLVDYNEKSLETAKQEISKAFPGVKINTVVADVSNEGAVKNYVDETIRVFGRIDGLYNNAGIEGKQAGITEYDVNIFKKVIDINLMGVYYGMRYVIPVMQKQSYGRIVNVASVGACLTLEFVTRNANKYGGVASFTGGLIGDKIYNENYKGDFAGTPIFIGTSNPDPHIPVERVYATTNILKNMNAVVTEKIYINMGHTINQDEIDTANSFIFKT